MKWLIGLNGSDFLLLMTALFIILNTALIGFMWACGTLNARQEEKDERWEDEQR